MERRTDRASVELPPIHPDNHERVSLFEGCSRGNNLGVKETAQGSGQIVS